MSDIDDRIAAALRAAANRVSEADLRAAPPPAGATAPGRRHIRWIAPVIAAAAVAGVAISVTAVANHPSANRPIPPGIRTPATSGPITGRPPQSASTPPNPSGSLACYFKDASLACDVVADSWYVPLWPYANYQQAEAEATVGCPSGHCGMTAQQTALAFTLTYLGFTDINRVTSSVVGQDQAHIGVGYLGADGKPKTAAVLHLVRYERYPGTASAPWEVVGSDDTTFSLETPKYGSTFPDGFTAGGHITGVDENIHVLVLKGNPVTTVADVCCLAAGGDNQPWSVKVGIARLSVIGPTVAVPMAVVASTGGHVQAHERFAIQGIYVVIPSS